MIGLLTSILCGVAAMGQMVLWGVVTGWNLIMAAIGAALAAAMALLPRMNDAPAISGEWIGWMNWFLPVGAMLSIFTAGITMYLVFMAVRYILRIAKMI